MFSNGPLPTLPLGAANCYELCPPPYSMLSQYRRINMPACTSLSRLCQHAVNMKLHPCILHATSISMHSRHLAVTEHEDCVLALLPRCPQCFAQIITPVTEAIAAADGDGQDLHEAAQGSSVIHTKRHDRQHHRTMTMSRQVWTKAQRQVSRQKQATENSFR